MSTCTLLLVKLRSSLRKSYGHHLILVDCYGIFVSQMTTDMYHLSHSQFITRFPTRLTRRVPLVEHELLTILDHLSSNPVLVGFVLLDL